MRDKRMLFALLALAAAMVMLLPARQHSQAGPDLGEIFDKTDVMIPMRDGVRLHTEI